MAGLHLKYIVPADDFTRAGEASGAVKSALKKIGLAPDLIRKVSISLYEGEINMVIHANGGVIHVDIDQDKITMVLEDTGPGIADIEQAMQEGYSTAPDHVRNLGFGAGMGLANMKKYSDEMEIESTVGIGTMFTMVVYIR